MTRRACLLIVFVVASACGPAQEGVTLAQFSQLRDGMSYAQASAALGRPGTEMSRTNISGIVTVMYSWQGRGRAGANMNAMFQNDRLISKAQFGLE